jgi:hypothetical protein
MYVIRYVGITEVCNRRYISLKTKDFWVKAPCGLVNSYQSLKSVNFQLSYSSHLGLLGYEDEDIALLRKFRELQVNFKNCVIYLFIYQR